MKKVLLLILIIIPGFVIAQNKYYADITKTNINSTVIYTSPSPDYINGMYFTLNKILYQNGSYISLQIGAESIDTTTNVSIYFRDKSRLQFSNVHFKRNYSNAIYTLNNKYIATLTLNRADLNKIKVTKIDHFQFNNDPYIFWQGGMPKKVMNYACYLDTLTAPANEINPIALISKTYDDMKNITTFVSPISASIRFQKTISPANTTTLLLFFIYKKTADDTQQTVYIKFDDGSVLNYPSTTSCEKMQNYPGYVYACGVVLTNDNIKNFKEKKIAKFQVADTNVIVDDPLGYSVNTWVNNAANLK